MVQTSLLGPNLPPRAVETIFASVTQREVGEVGSRRCTREELFEVLLAIRLVRDPQVALEAWFPEVCFPAINEVMPLAGGSLAKSVNKDGHFLSTAKVNLQAAKKYLAQVATSPRNCSPPPAPHRNVET